MFQRALNFDNLNSLQASDRKDKLKAKAAMKVPLRCKQTCRLWKRTRSVGSLYRKKRPAKRTKKKPRCQTRHHTIITESKPVASGVELCRDQSTVQDVIRDTLKKLEAEGREKGGG